MSKVRAAVLAATLLGAGVGSVPAWAGPASPDVASPPAAAPEMLAAMQRDLGLSAEQAGARFTQESAAQRTAQAVRRSLVDRQAGVWFDSSTGQLVVAVTDQHAADQARRAGARPQLVEHDQRRLDRAAAAVAGFVSQDKPAGVTSWGVDTRGNSVEVTIDRTTARAGLAARLRTLDAVVRVVETDSSPRQQGGDVRGGDKWNPEGENPCSIGFAATGSGGSKHFLTAGHCTNNINNAANGKDGTVLGVQAASTNGTTGDYGRVDVTAADWNLSATVNGYGNGDVTVTGSADAIVGQSVCRSGQTTQWRCGTVTKVNQTVNYSNPDITVSGLSFSDACSEGGDSGGSWVSGTTAVGLHEGGTANGCQVSTHEAYFQPVNEALTAYGLTLYTGTSTPAPTPAGCTGYQSTYTGSLTGSTTTQYQPDGNYYQSTASGTHKACLQGPASGADFDLYLKKYNGSGWDTVASSLGSTSAETISYNGAAGYYYYEVVADSGTGSYTLAITKP